MIKSIATLLLMFLCVTRLIGQEKDILNQMILLPKDQNISVEKLLEQLKKDKVNIVYPGDSEYLKTMLSLPDVNKTSLGVLLKLISENTPYTYVVKNGYIILKQENLKDDYKLKGMIQDAATGEYLIGASVIIEKTGKGVMSNTDGSFSINLEPDTYLITLRSIGYENQEHIVNLFKDTQLNIKLTPSEVQLNEVVVTSETEVFGDLSIGRPIETISSKTLESLPLNNAADALHGRINGVWATKMSGAPGDHQKIRIRGISSLFGSVDPLYVVDNVPVPKVNLQSLGIADLNVHDIESITILKDAASTALYGYQGGSGVILIETKKGSKETKINFAVKQGVQWNTKRYDLMNSYDFLQTYKYSDEAFNSKYFYFRIPTQDFSAVTAKYPEYRFDTKSEDWQNYLFKPGQIEEYQTSMQGSLKGLMYYMSGNVFNHLGVVRNSSYTKKSFAINLRHDLFKKGFLQFTSKTSFQENLNNLDTFGENPVLYSGINTDPSFYSTPDSILAQSERALYANAPNNIRHRKGAGWLANHQERTLDIRSNAMSLFGNYQIANRLVLEYNTSLSSKKFVYISNLPEQLLQSNNRGSIDLFLSSKEKVTVLNQNLELGYSLPIGNHTFGFNSGIRNYRDNSYWKIDSTLHAHYFEQEDHIYIRGSMARFGSGGSATRRINSVITHISYGYKQKYQLSLLTNYSMLKEDFGIRNSDLFYSYSASWDLAQEKWLQLNWLQNLKIYGNYGKVGNYPLNGLSNDIYNKTFYVESGGNTQEAQYLNNLSNHKLQPETAREYNLGLNTSIMDTRVELSVNYFNKHNKDLIIQREIPLYYGGGSLFLNIGSMKNNGLEWRVDVVPIYGKNFQWQTRIGWSTFNQIIEKLDSGKLVFNNDDLLYPDFVIEENKPIGGIKAYDYRGIHTQEQLRELNSSNNDGIFLDADGLTYFTSDSSATVLKDELKRTVGNAIPKWTFNWQNTFQYRSFQLDILLYGVMGVDKINSTRAATYANGTNQETLKIMADNEKYLRSNAFYESSYFIEDASFIRLKSITLAYTQKQLIRNRLKMMYSLSVENLVTWTSYTGYDPEAAIYTGNNFSDNALDRGSYPNPISLYFTINMTLK